MPIDSTIILASGSKYRFQQLSQLGVPFKVVPPEVNEEEIKQSLLAGHVGTTTTPLSVTPSELAQKLSYAKGASVAKDHPSDIVISGDQLVAFNHEILNKPLSIEKAIAQLSQLSGKEHQLITHVDIFYQGQVFSHTNISQLQMKALSDSEIKHYVSLDNPVDCAGSYKIESYGIGLFSAITTEDFSAIQGIPLLWVSEQIRRLGYELFSKR